MKIMSASESSSCVRGHHIYKDIWSPVLGEELSCSKESDNDKDPSVMKVAGHIPRKISADSLLFLQKGCLFN